MGVLPNFCTHKNSIVGFPKVYRFMRIIPEKAGGLFNMKEIFQEYGGVLITVVAILAVILVVTAVVGKDASSPIGNAFSTLINNFIAQANANTGLGK